MKYYLLTIMATLVSATHAVDKNSTTLRNGYPYSSVPFTSVKMDGQAFWGERIRVAREVTIPLAFEKCESSGRYANFTMAAHPNKNYEIAKFMVNSFDDTDVYKTIEGASYVLQTYPDKSMEAYIDSVITLLEAAQEPDGYLYTARTINPEHPHRWAGSHRWSKEEESSHELYNLGHLIDAACAHYQATGSRRLLDIACRYADCVLREVGPAEGQAHVVPGHQIAEMALARLYLLTGQSKYLDEARYFLDYRGKTKMKREYSQCHLPVTKQREAVGHAVRAGYMYAGMADVAALTGDSAYIHAIDAITENIISCKYYLTGGVGALHRGEAFGAKYELPNLTAYNETCAAISMVYLMHRMFLLHGDARYIDCLERTLYNGVISGMSVDGGRFFYPNPLQSNGRYRFNHDRTITRQPWFNCACCPSNLCRFIPSLPGYLYAVRNRSVFVNLYAASTADVEVEGKCITLEQTTDYPWTGDVNLRVVQNKAGEVELCIRIPGWVRGQVVPSDLYHYSDDVQLDYTIMVNGVPVQGTQQNGYERIKRKWKKGDVVQIHFDMQPRMVVANDKVTDDRGRVAFERGPLVYCAEQYDNDEANPLHILIGKDPQWTVEPGYGIKNSEGDGKTFHVVSIATDDAQLAGIASDGRLTVKDLRLRLIPYYAWNHRGAACMTVWLAKQLSSFDD